jgi:predicted chitinase
MAKLPKSANLELVNNLLDPQLLNKYGLNNQTAVRNMLAQTAHESGGFKYMNELGGKSYFNRYEPSTSAGRSLGNTEKGDGYLFRGRGPLQLTGRANYEKYGNMIGHDLIANPDLAADPKVGAELTMAYLKDRVGDKLLNSNNITGITRKVNGGLNGLADRKRWYASFGK